MRNYESGKYIIYQCSIDSSLVFFGDTMEECTKDWCIGRLIFESNGVTKTDLLKDFHNERNENLLEHLIENFNCVFQEGVLVRRIPPTREVLIEKLKIKILTKQYRN